MIGDHRAKFPGFLVLVLALTSASAPAAADEAPDPRTGDHLIERSGSAMGTVVRVTVWTSDEARAVAAIDRVMREFGRLDAMMTTWTATSEVSRINAAAGSGEPVPVSPEVLECLARGQEAARISGGAFDLTVGSFAGVWKFDEDNDGTIPARALVEERRRLVNFRDLLVDRAGGTARLRRKGQRITLGGIAKGYAVDRGAAILREAGFADFILQAGGDMFVSGRRGDRRWRVGIRDPRGPKDRFFAAAEVEDRTFSTSGDYERFTVKDGRRYHHILDPRTGYPTTGVRSVTIMARDAVTAEVLSKIVFIWGVKRGLALVRRTPGVEAVIVDAANRVHVSPGLRGALKLLSPPTDGI
jgi:thiamine biosynthesis lipoprotein